MSDLVGEQLGNYRKHMKFIDLSVPINEHVPVYPGDPVTSIRSNATFEKDGYEVHFPSP